MTFLFLTCCQVILHGAYGTKWEGSGSGLPSIYRVTMKLHQDRERKVMHLLPTGSEEGEVLGVGGIPVAMLNSLLSIYEAIAS